MSVIDIHTHGIGGYDTKMLSEDDILKIAEIQGYHGVSEILLTIYPSTIKMMRDNMHIVKKARDKQDTRCKMQDTRSRIKENKNSGIMDRASFIRNYNSELKAQTFTPSKIIGIHLEGPFLNPSECGALDAKAFIEPTEYKFKKLIEGFEDIVKVITIAPEIKGATSLIRKMSGKGIIVSMGHSDATYAEAEAGFQAGADGITHIFNAMCGFHHREPGIAGFGLLNQDIYIEVIADPYHLHVKTLDLIFKTKNPDRIIIVSDSVKGTKKRKNKRAGQAITDALGRISGGCMTVTESSKRLIEMGFDENLIMRCITKNPERYLFVR
jgi:N-acetylglucosamine-6-phosphate deacetylase